MLSFGNIFTNMRIGTFIKQHAYNDRGNNIYRYGIVIELITRKEIKVVWLPNSFFPRQQALYKSIIKMELIEIISEVC